MITHYGISMRFAELQKWGAAIAKEISSLIDSGVYPMMAYTGMSGVATATAIMMHIPADKLNKCATLYVRKENENSHGRSIEHNLHGYGIQGITVPEGMKPRFIFVDDFICGGDTLVWVIKKVSENINTRINPDNALYALSWTQREDGRPYLRTWDESMPDKKKGKERACKHILYQTRRNWVLHNRNTKRRARSAVRYAAEQFGIEWLTTSTVAI